MADVDSNDDENRQRDQGDERHNDKRQNDAHTIIWRLPVGDVMSRWVIEFYGDKEFSNIPIVNNGIEMKLVAMVSKTVLAKNPVTHTRLLLHREWDMLVLQENGKGMYIQKPLRSHSVFEERAINSLLKSG